MAPMAPVKLPVKRHAALHFKSGFFGRRLPDLHGWKCATSTAGNKLTKQRKSVGLIFKFKVSFTEFVE